MTEERAGFTVPVPSQLTRSATATAEVPDLRHSEVQAISDRLGRCGKFPMATAWLTLATLAAGALLGGGLGLIPFLATSPGPTDHWEMVYFVALGVVLLVLILSGAAAWTTHKERAESITDIKADLDKHILGTFEWVPERGGGAHQTA